MPLIYKNTTGIDNVEIVAYGSDLDLLIQRAKNINCLESITLSQYNESC